MSQSGYVVGDYVWLCGDMLCFRAAMLRFGSMGTDGVPMVSLRSRTAMHDLKPIQQYCLAMDGHGWIGVNWFSLVA